MSRFDAAQRKRLAAYRTGADPLETEQDEQNRPVFSIRQQGNQGRKRRLPATAATATVLSSLTTATDFPLLYALKREMQSWRLLHLDPRPCLVDQVSRARSRSQILMVAMSM
ncbi:hypothetical protein ACLQ24_30320, partial [Micromonospora sp. DT4]|uniref:hypothetical protein n=1 Tax=Micromonospora sp. DT4 TaxID=3393438 RepID=UPI003CECF95C